MATAIKTNEMLLASLADKQMEILRVKRELENLQDEIIENCFARLDEDLTQLKLLKSVFSRLQFRARMHRNA